MTTLGFVGLGNMGAGMAANLVRHGFDVVVHDVRREPAERLRALGAGVAAGNAELARRAEIVFVAAFGPEHVREICLGTGEDSGLVANLLDGGVIVIHSTVAPADVGAIAERARERGIDVLDAAMTGGGHLAAEDGRLTFFVGGPAPSVARVRPYLDAMASQVRHVGALGTGVVVKTLSNFLSIGNTILVNEALRLGRAHGMDVETLLAMVGVGKVGASWVSENWADLRAQERNYTTDGGMADMARKDLSLARDSASWSGVSMPTLEFLAGEIAPKLARLIAGSDTPTGEPA